MFGKERHLCEGGGLSPGDQLCWSWRDWRGDRLDVVSRGCTGGRVLGDATLSCSPGHPQQDEHPLHTELGREQPWGGQGQELDLVISVDPFPLRIFCDFSQKGEAGLHLECPGRAGPSYTSCTKGSPVQECPCSQLWADVLHVAAGALGSSGGEQRSGVVPAVFGLSGRACPAAGPVLHAQAWCPGPRPPLPA